MVAEIYVLCRNGCLQGKEGDAVNVSFNGGRFLAKSFLNFNQCPVLVVKKFIKHVFSGPVVDFRALFDGALSERIWVWKILTEQRE